MGTDLHFPVVTQTQGRAVVIKWLKVNEYQKIIAKWHINSVTKPFNTLFQKDVINMEKLELVSSNKIFGGYQKVYAHVSEELKCKMNFSIYLPPQAEGGDIKLPVVFYLSGLTCTEQNFVTKSGFQRYLLKEAFYDTSIEPLPYGEI